MIKLEIKKIIEEHPRQLQYTNMDRIIKELIKRRHPQSYSKIDSKTWELIISDFIIGRYEIEKLLRR